MDGLFEVWWKWIREERGAKKNDLEKFGKNEYWTLFIQLNVPFCGKSTLSSDNTSRKVLLRDKQKYWLPRTDWKLTSKKRKSVESCIDWIKISLILFMRRGDGRGVNHFRLQTQSAANRETKIFRRGRWLLRCASDQMFVTRWRHPASMTRMAEAVTKAVIGDPVTSRIMTISRSGVTRRYNF